MIILTSQQAEQVRGETSPGYALDPVALADGVTFVLPESVLTDPAHKCHHALLAARARRSVGAAEYLQGEA